jgi:CrcB protein
VIWVALGGALGALARASVALVLDPRLWLATLAVNVLGSLAIGFAVARIDQRWWPFVVTGFLGGFTTFSAFALDAVELYSSGDPLQALAYVVITLVAGIAAVPIGSALAGLVRGPRT